METSCNENKNYDAGDRLLDNEEIKNASKNFEDNAFGSLRMDMADTNGDGLLTLDECRAQKQKEIRRKRRDKKALVRLRTLSRRRRQHRKRPLRSLCKYSLNHVLSVNICPPAIVIKHCNLLNFSIKTVFPVNMEYFIRESM
jgi:hypothetical protein